MSDTNTANDLRAADAVSAAGLSLTEEQASGKALASGGAGVPGFDVNAAAAELWSTASPGAAPAAVQRFAAADYGWDSADPNAVAWAAYYSEQGLDPAAVAAQQAAEVAGAAEPAAEPAPELSVQASSELEPLPELAFAPLAELDLAPAGEASPALPEVPAADFEAAGSSLWDLLPAPDALQPTAEHPPAEQRDQPPGGWPGDDAPERLDEFHLAGGGSFDEATAPIADLSPERLVEAYPPGVDLTPDPDDAFEPLAAPPGPVFASPPLPASSDDLPPIDLGGMGVEQELAVPLEPEVSIDLGFVEDEPPFAAPGESVTAAAAPPSEPAELPHAPEMDWAAELAVPAGDGAIDLASFEAPPQADEQPAPRDGTAMWGLARNPSPAAAGPRAFPAPAPQDDPWDAQAGSEAAPLPPPELELPPPELAPADGFGPFDLGALEAAAPDPAAEPLPLAFLELAPAEPEVLEATEEQILEVGEEVIEVVPADEPPLPAAEVAEPAVAPVVETRSAEPPPPEPILAPAEPAPAAAAPAPAPLSTYIAGPHRVVIHTADGQVKRGTVCDVALDGPELLLQPQAGGAAEALPAERVKAIFFMLATGEAPPTPAGKKVRVTFRDGRQVAGFSPDYQPDRAGFFMIPVDTRTHTARIWVYRTSVRQVTVT